MSKNTPPVTSSTIAYLRASTDKQEVNNQKLEILEYARKHDLKIDEFIEVTTVLPPNIKPAGLNI